MSTVKKVTAAPAKKAAEKAVKAVETKAAEVKAVEVKEEVKAPVAEAKAPAAEKKTAVKKTAAKATTVKKTTAKKAVKAAEVKIAVQFADKNYTADDFAKIANDVWVYDYGKDAADLKDVQLYVKPEESKVYYVFNNEITGDFNI